MTTVHQIHPATNACEVLVGGGGATARSEWLWVNSADGLRHGRPPK